MRASQRTLVLSRHFGDNQEMSAMVNVAIHPSQFPEKVRADLLESLRTRTVNHKFHYDSVKQTQQWLALHQTYSPSRNDADCAAIYDRVFEVAAASGGSKQVHLIGLGCGGGQKDMRLLRLLKARNKEAFYSPCDVSTAMVLTARETALAVVPEEKCFPVVCDLSGVDDLSTIFAPRNAQGATRFITFFGMIPNFEPSPILPKLASLVRREDVLLFSANLSPERNYGAGMKKILPQYDNAQTRVWLLTFLLDLGVEKGDGELSFTVEDVNELKRIVARFQFGRLRTLEVDGERFEFRTGDSIRLFFSYRYTPALVRETLARYGLEVMEEWITKSEEEGVFFCRRK